MVLPWSMDQARGTEHLDLDELLRRPVIDVEGFEKLAAQLFFEFGEGGFRGVG